MAKCLKNGTLAEDHRLDRLEPPDWKHVEKYPLVELIAAGEAPRNIPAIVGWPWFSNFDSPVRDKNGHYWIGMDKNNLGRVRGGHCVCLKPPRIPDGSGWQAFYDQGSEGACVEFGTSRAMSLLNRHRFDVHSHWLYWEAQKIDSWPGGSYPGASPVYEGTEVRAALEIARTKGMKPYKKNKDISPDPIEGIVAYRWATDVQDILNTLGMGGRDYVVILNSWGNDYPHMVRMPADTVHEIMANYDGECAFVTDR